MIFVKLRTGQSGCGVVGDNLARALSALTPVTRLDWRSALQGSLDGPLLERLTPRYRPSSAATRNIAYAVFEHDLAVGSGASRAIGLFDAIAPASRWCEAILRQAGLRSIETIHQGVDCALFNPARAVRTRWLDRFVVFTGGKFEFRKSQDVVVHAFRVLAQRHSDALLVACWPDSTAKFTDTMMVSPYHPFRRAGGKGFHQSIRCWLACAGIGSDRVELLPSIGQRDLADIYGNSDVGLFPNRCEGGTNLVMMEYMACGRPVIATDFSGHCDVLTDLNSVPLRSSRPLLVFAGGQPVAQWCEPDVDEIVERLEESYRNRERFHELGRRAAVDLADWTWDLAAQRFLRLLTDGCLPAIDT